MKVIICDDQSIVREGLAMLLKLEPDIQVTGIAEDGAMAVELVEKEKPDLVLMDLKMPVMNGVDATRYIHTRYPEIKVLVLTTYDDDQWVFDAIKAGASGYLLKDTPREELIKAVKGTAAGKTFVDPSIAGKILEQVSSHQTRAATQVTCKLTEREIEILISPRDCFYPRVPCVIMSAPSSLNWVSPIALVPPFWPSSTVWVRCLSLIEPLP
jgi:DNA-binding NarL/FixJ family response regulator